MDEPVSHVLTQRRTCPECGNSETSEMYEEADGLWTCMDCGAEFKSVVSVLYTTELVLP